MMREANRKPLIFLTVLAAALCFSLTACVNTDDGLKETAVMTEETEAVSEPEELTNGAADEEIQKLMDLALLPEEIQGDYNAQITYREFCQVLDLAIEALRPEAAESWKKASAGYRDKEEPMSRMEGAIVMLCAARESGFDTAGYNEAAFLDGKAAPGTDFFKDVPMDFPLLPAIHEPYYHETFANIDYENWRNEMDVRDYARYFAEYTSYVSRKPYFDYDENFNLNLSDKFTRGDAYRAVLRFYETANYFIYEPVELLQCGISEEAIAQAEKMPAVSWQELPKWRGYQLPVPHEALQFGRPSGFAQEDITILKDMGFNFVRVFLEFDDFYQGTDTSLASRGYLEALDHLIEYCAEDDIHICLCLYNMPGCTTDANRDDDTLFWNPEQQQLFVDFWRLLSTRYQKVPANLLSFNLLNEPHPMTGETLTDELYSSVMKKAIDVIRESRADRLIFADMLDIAACKPVYGLVDMQVAESVHPYFLLEGVSQWPVYLINGAVNVEGGVLQMKGSFPANSEIEISLSGVQGNSDFTLLADGQTIGEFHLGGEALYEDGCEHIANEGTDEEYREFINRYWTFTVPKDCSVLEIQQTGGRYYQLSYLKVTTKDWKTQIVADPSRIDDYQHPLLTFDETGAVTADKAERLVALDRAWVEELVRSLAAFREETKIPVMVQEFGYNFTIPSDTACAVAEDFLSLLDEYDIPWCCTCNAFGPLISEKEHEWRINEVKETPREGATYETVREGWLVQKEFMDVLKRHMGQ